MVYFCTCFDSNYLSRGLALHASLMKHAGDFKLLVLCFDAVAYEYLVREKPYGVVPVREEDFIKNDLPLQQAQRNRNRFEFYFTCTPSLALYALENFPDAEIITYLDADLFFYNNPAALDAELGSGSILMLEHRLPFLMRHKLKYGRYNVGYLSFRRDASGLACLRWWRERCNEWCYDRLEGERFADQKYLDQWPGLFPGVVVSQNHGAGLAPWNIGRSKVRGMTGGNEVSVDGHPLIFYHFHGLKYASPYLFYDRLIPNLAVLGPVAVKLVYLPYLRVLSRFIKCIQHKESVLRRGAGSTSLRGLLRYLISSYYFLLPEFIRDLIRGK
jgi:hypothetical protein